MSTPAERMSVIFEGYSSAHGTHGATTNNPNKNGKQEIKRTARTVREDVTVEKWEKHLSGEKPLGIIPIREDHTCVWGCIDVDRYDIDHADVVKELKKRKLPLILCKSKSGGAHIYLFSDKPYPAVEFRHVLKQVAASMGWGDCEIFPKQNEVLSERGDLGSWLNMPYLGGDKTTRFAVKETTAAYSVSEFLSLAEKLKVDIHTIKTTKKKSPNRAGAGDEEGELGDGPPCLQHLCEEKFTAGIQNNGMIAIATFCKKKYGSKWKEKVEEFNRTSFDPPIPADEVLDIIKRVDAKDYNYRCKDQPLVSYCNSSLCRMRKFGVGGSGAFPVISGLTKMDTDPAIWFVDIEDQRVELTSKQLQNYKEFQLVCMEQLTIYFVPLTNDVWARIVGDAMEKAVTLEAPPEMSVRGAFMEHLDEFCNDRHSGETKEDIRLGKPWHDPAEGKHFFRLRDLMKYLERENFRDWGRNTIGRLIVEELGGKKFFNLSGRGVNVVYVRSDLFERGEPVATREIEEDPI